LQGKNIHFIHNAIILGYFELLKTKVRWHLIRTHND
jgi:hypothetical protein